MLTESCYISAQHISMTPMATCAATGLPSLCHTCRVTQLEPEDSEDTAILQGHVGPQPLPSSLPADGDTYAHSYAAETQNASSKAQPRPGAGRAKEGEAKGHPCSHFAWELQDLHNRMAAAIAQIRCAPQGTASGIVPKAQHMSQGSNLPSIIRR